MQTNVYTYNRSTRSIDRFVVIRAIVCPESYEGGGVLVPFVVTFFFFLVPVPVFFARTTLIGTGVLGASSSTTYSGKRDGGTTAREPELLAIAEVGRDGFCDDGKDGGMDIPVGISPLRSMVYAFTGGSSVLARKIEGIRGTGADG